MINSVYQLVSPQTFAIKFEDIADGNVIVRPHHLALCHADQRYYQGKRDANVLRRKLPMALIHECCGQVVSDPTSTFRPGDFVVMIPNVPGLGPDFLFENYVEGSGFLSSGRDGFTREVVNLSPDRIVPFEGIDPAVAAITEFVSVAVHAVHRFGIVSHERRERIAVIGDGSMAFVVACVLLATYPESELIIVGHNRSKLTLFSFATHMFLEDEVPSDFIFDHAFECAGGEGSAAAIDMVIDHIRPQGSLMLLGVSERPVPVYTRNVLEKGLTLVGCSRSGREDFECALSLMGSANMQQRLRQIIFVDDPVCDISDLKRAFATDIQTPFKTVFRWGF